MGVSVTGWFFPASAGRTLKGRGSNSAAFCIVFSAPRISRESLDDIASRVRWIITEPSRIDWSYQPLFQRQSQCCIKPMQKKPFQRWSEWLGCGHAIELAGRAGSIAGLGCPPQAMLMQRLKDWRRCSSRRTRHAAMLTPALMHLFPARFHSGEALLKCRADRGLLLVVQRVIEVQPRGARLVAQLGILLLDFLMRRVHGVQIENGLLLH